MKLKSKILKIALVCIVSIITIGTSIALPFILQRTLADPVTLSVYSISNEQQLKDWLSNTNSIQTNNPNAQLTEDISLNWGNTSPYGTIIENGSLLDGTNHTITLVGFNGTTVGGTMYGQLGLFVNFINGTLQNTNFDINTVYDIRIHADTAQRNEQLYTGVLCGKMERGQVLNCTVNINASIYFNTNTKGYTNYSDASSNHFGVIAGGMWGNSVVSNVVVKQASGTILQTYADQGFSYLRIGMITADPYKDDTGVPTIKNVFIERSGEIKFKNEGWGAGGEIFGVVLADLDTGGDGANHQVVIDGVIYTSTLGSDPNVGISYNNRRERTDNLKGYIVGAIKESVVNYSIQNVYALIDLSNSSYVTSMGCGYTYLSSDYTYQFVGDMLQFTPISPVENEFIWQIAKNATGEVFDVHVNISNVATIAKTNTSTAILKDTFTITKGTIKTNAVFGFTETEVVYNGLAYENVQANIDGEIITSGFKVIYENNLHAFPTTQQQASFSLMFDEREDGFFVTDRKYYVPKTGITYENETMHIQPASLKLIYSGTNIYDNELVIQGLVNNEKVTIDGNLYGNNVYSFECLSNSTQKQIEFISCVATDYSIEQFGINDFVFEVLPYTITLTGNVAIEQTNPEWFAVQDSVLQIYSKQVTSFDMKQTSVAGQMHVYTLTSSAPENYTLSRKIDNGMEVVTLQANGTLQQLQGITLTTQMKQIAVRLSLQMPEGDSVTCIVNVNENETLYPMGESLVAVSQYGNEITIVITLDEAYKDAYTLTYMQGEEPIISQNGVLTITTTSVAGDTNLMEMIVVVEKV